MIVIMPAAARSLRAAARSGFTLLEVSVVLVVLAVLLAVALPSLRPKEAERLVAAADLLAADLRLAQSLAIRDGTDFTLSATSAGWKIEHTGSGPAPVLPKPALGGVAAATSSYEINVALLVGRPVLVAGRLATTGASTDSVTFTATGRTTATENTVFWLVMGGGNEALSLPLTVAAPTGLVTAGPLARGLPPGS